MAVGGEAELKNLVETDPEHSELNNPVPESLRLTIVKTLLLEQLLPLLGIAQNLQHNSTQAKLPQFKSSHITSLRLRSPRPLFPSVKC